MASRRSCGSAAWRLTSWTPAQRMGGGDHDILNDSFFANLYERSVQAPTQSCSLPRLALPTPSHGSSSHQAKTVPPWSATAGAYSASTICRRDTVVNCTDQRDHPAHRLTIISGQPRRRRFCDREPGGQRRRHGPLALPGFQSWSHLVGPPHALTMVYTGSLEAATFAQCMFGAGTQKYTTFWFTPGLTPQLQSLKRLLCTHAPGAHASAAGGVRADDGTWNSAATSAYPADLNLFVAEAILQRIIIRETALADEVKLDLAPLLNPPPSQTVEAPLDAPAISAPAQDVPVPDEAAVEGQLETEVRTPEADPEADLSGAPLPARASPNKRRHRKVATDHFQRGLGAISLSAPSSRSKPTGTEAQQRRTHRTRGRYAFRC